MVLVQGCLAVGEPFRGVVGGDMGAGKHVQSRDELARAAGTSQARMEAFETNNAMPTLRQLGLLGKTR
mgnify:CR=1 FL=1